MAWRIDFERSAARELNQMDPPQRRRILSFLNERIIPGDNPRRLGEALHGSTLGEFWKYRVGDSRIIAKIEDERLLVLIVRIGHRRNIYKKR